MARVFVSYAREDVTKAQAIARALEQASFDVWFDQRIHSGSEYSREIEEALKDAAAVVVLWSQSSVDSAWVRDEAAEGRDSGRLVPILLDGSRPPIGFRQFQTTDLSHWSGRGTPKQLADVVAAVAAKAGAPPRPAARIAAVKPSWWRRPLPLAATALVLVIAAAAAFLWLRPAASPSSALTIALLPFSADSTDPEARKLASAAHDSIAHTLSQSAFALTALDSVPKDRKSAGDYVMSGAVRRTGDKFVVTVRMDDAARDIVILSHQFEASRDKAEDFPELIGGQVASGLSWTAPLLALERRHPSDPAIVAALLKADTAGMGKDPTAPLREYETARRLVGEAPNSPLAQNSYAFNTAFALDQIPRAERVDAVAAARRAADRTIEIAPDYGSAYVPWCLLHSSVQFAACEQRLRKGMRADPDDPFANWFLSRMLNNVGRNEEASELASVSLAHDPYMPLKIAHMLRMLELNGRVEEADQLYRQSAAWWPDNEAINWFRLTGIMQRGDFEAMQKFASAIGKGAKPSAALVAINRKALPALKQACAAAKEEDALVCLFGLAKLGDLDAAYALTGRIYPSQIGRTPGEEDRIWLDQPSSYPVAYLTSPAAAPLRRDSRFLGLAQRVGLLAYWRSGRLPDFCRSPQPEPICGRLRPR